MRCGARWLIGISKTRCRKSTDLNRSPDRSFRNPSIFFYLSTSVQWGDGGRFLRLSHCKIERPRPQRPSPLTLGVTPLCTGQNPFPLFCLTFIFNIKLLFCHYNKDDRWRIIAILRFKRLWFSLHVKKMNLLNLAIIYPNTRTYVAILCLFKFASFKLECL